MLTNAKCSFVGANFQSLSFSELIDAGNIKQIKTLSYQPKGASDARESIILLHTLVLEDELLNLF